MQIEILCMLFSLSLFYYLKKKEEFRLFEVVTRAFICMYSKYMLKMFQKFNINGWHDFILPKFASSFSLFN